MADSSFYSSAPPPPAATFVRTFKGRPGAVVPTIGDYPASFITNTPVGNITATDIQTAINQLGDRKLSADLTFYVRPDGSNSNSGRLNTAGGAFLTIQKAVDTLARLDLNYYNVQILVADGDYTGPTAIAGAWTGFGSVSIIGNFGTPANCRITTTGAQCFSISNRASVTIMGFKLSTTDSHECVTANTSAYVILGAMNWGDAVLSSHISIAGNATVIVVGLHTISGTFINHVHQPDNSTLNYLPTLTIAPGANMTGAFCGSRGASTYSSFVGLTYTGSFPGGSKFITHFGSVIDDEGGSISRLPGATAGVVGPGGMHIGTVTTIAGDVVNGNGQYKGTSTNDAAAAGYIGEYASNFIASGSAVSLSSDINKTVVSLALTAGEWDVQGIAYFAPFGATTRFFRTAACISATTDVNETPEANCGYDAAGTVIDTFGVPSLLTPPRRTLLAAPATLYLVVRAGFSTSTLKAYGNIWARRVR